jgi:hypothetical protein
MTGGILHVVATDAEGSTVATTTANIAVSVSGLFDFVYTYPDGKDYYNGAVADVNGAFGYQAGQVVSLPGGGRYQITGQEAGSDLAPLATGLAAGSVFTTFYSHGGIGAASTQPQKDAIGQPAGFAGLGSEVDTILGTDGQPHAFSPTVEATFPVNTQFGFIFDYADGSAFYTGTVSDNGSFGYGTVAATANASIVTVNPATSAIAGRYILFAEGQTTDPSGTVKIATYHDGPSGSTFTLGGISGTTGLGNEQGGFLLDGVSFTFSNTQELLDPPTPPTPPVLDGVAASTLYTAGQGAVAISPGLRLSDPDGAAIVSASVAIGAGAYADDGDLLTAVTAGTGISASYDPATETLTLSGSGSAGLYQQVLDSVAFQSSAADPTGGSRDPFRSVSWQVSDANGAIAGAGTTLLLSLPAGVSPAPTSPAPTPSAAAAEVAMFDTTTGQSGPVAAIAYAGPVAGLQHQFVYSGGDSVSISVSSDNWFVHGGAGDDALAAHGGYNVLDGGAGSNFLTGGSGTDTFFVDDRNPATDVWTTVNGFHAGDDATVFGVAAAAGNANVQWFDNQGAAGYTGLTLHVFGQNAPTASLTLVGYSSSDLNNGRLTVQFGNEHDRRLGGSALSSMDAGLALSRERAEGEIQERSIRIYAAATAACHCAAASVLKIRSVDREIRCL